MNSDESESSGGVFSISSVIAIWLSGEGSTMLSKLTFFQFSCKKSIERAELHHHRLWLATRPLLICRHWLHYGPEFHFCFIFVCSWWPGRVPIVDICYILTRKLSKHELYFFGQSNTAKTNPNDFDWSPPRYKRHAPCLRPSLVSAFFKRNQWVDLLHDPLSPRSPRSP